jgi:hypothetical protein
MQKYCSVALTFLLPAATREVEKAFRLRTVTLTGSVTRSQEFEYKILPVHQRTSSE